jgi:transposase-like protein
MFLVRGIVFSYEAIRDCEAKLTPALAEDLRRSRKGKVGRSWYIDETYIRVHGDWKYLYRAIDRDGALVDVRLSEHRNLAAAKRFFRSAKAVTGVIPDRVTTDGHDAYPRAIRTELGSRVRHRTSGYLNNRLEQDHRGIKSCCRPMPGFKSVLSASDTAGGRTAQFSALPVPHVPTRSGRYATLSLHAPDGDRARYPGSCLNGALRRVRGCSARQARTLTEPVLPPCPLRAGANRLPYRRCAGSGGN